ncbi:MAG TPA: hypothetical protein VLA68_01485 [Nitrososphaera sp.]|nr:hypothetical protein [Nitrososphaera sp.]
MSEQDWSQWLDFDRANVDAAPESPGTFVMHANMKTMYIGGGLNIKKALTEQLADSCASRAKRFRYRLTDDFERAKEQLLKEYVEKHGGKLPLCMENR